MKIKISNKAIGDKDPVFIVAEISSNHGQNFNRAVNLIKKAKQCGADAVKFQTFTLEGITINANNRYFQIKHAEWGGQTLFELYTKAYTPWSWLKKLKRIADDLGIIFFSAAFDRDAVDFLEELDVPVHKIASFELVDLPLIEYIAKTKRPLMISTGMGKFSEIKEAVSMAKQSGAKDIILLKCVSDYPANPEEMNLKTIAHMQKVFKCPVGVSDHSLGLGVSIAAVTLGAKVIEKHFTLSRQDNTLDNFFSLEPEELRNLVKNIRIAEKATGKVYYGITREERKSLIFRRSLFTVKDIKTGEVFSTENIKSVRPANGLKPKYLKIILGKKAKQDIRRGQPLSWKLVSRANKVKHNR